MKPEYPGNKEEKSVQLKCYISCSDPEKVKQKLLPLNIETKRKVMNSLIFNEFS